MGAAVEALGRLCAGGASVAVKCRVVRCLGDGNLAVRNSAVAALVATCGRGSHDAVAISLVSEVLEFSESWGVRQSCAHALRGICAESTGHSHAAAISALAEGRDEQIWQRSLAAILGTLRPLSH